MHEKGGLVRGWSRHQQFGLRQEWLELYLDRPHAWEAAGALGNRQVQALKVWLKTAGLVDGGGRETFLASLFRAQGMEAVLPWELVWTNVVFNFPTAAWYVTGPATGEWTTGELTELLLRDVPRLAKRTACNAVMELVGLLERTPVGRRLNQGAVLPGRPRHIRRLGHNYPTAAAILYATWRLFVREKRERLGLEENILWPWTVFGCRRDYALQKIILAGSQWFTVTDDGLLAQNIPGEVQLCGFMLTTSR
ncbi:MAG: hypothetical protein H5T99_11405 [Moorella sp. (in: Bacteria)]|nr:hypothetical protein [Moorella sp. (in: firmicutes)]